MASRRSPSCTFQLQTRSGMLQSIPPRVRRLLTAALLLAACGGDVQAATLAIKYRTGDQETYHVHQVFTAALAGAAGQVKPLTFDLRAVETTRVTAVAADGSATLEVQLLDTTGTSNGQQLPPLGTQSYQLQVGADGRILGGGASAAGTSAVSIPSADQSFSILPDRKVKPGDGWTRDFERPNPLGASSLKVHSENRFLRYEQLDGVQAAVVESKLTTPVDQQVTLAGQPLQETGTVTAKVTSWVDAGAGRFLKGTSSSKFQLAAAGYQLQGSQTQELDRASP